MNENKPRGCLGCLAKTLLVVVGGAIAFWLIVPGTIERAPVNQSPEQSRPNFPVSSPQTPVEPKAPHTIPPEFVTVDFARLKDIESANYGEGQQVKLKLINHSEHPVMAVAGIYTFRDRQRNVIYTVDSWLPFAGGENPQDWLQPGASWLTPFDEGFRFYPQVQSQGTRAAFVDVTVTRVYLRGPVE